MAGAGPPAPATVQHDESTKMHSTTHPHRQQTLVAIAATGLLTLAGCTSGSDHELAMPEKNRAQWVTPLDAYVPQNLVAGSYAETLLDGQCMQAAGYADWVVPWRETNPDDGPSWNSVGTRLFNDDLASRYGYRPAPAVRSDTNPAWNEFSRRVNTNTTVAEDRTFVACQETVRKKHPLIAPDAGSMNLALGYLAQASEVAQKAQPTLDAAAKWRACMEPEGVSDLPPSPQQMPPASLREKFGLDSGQPTADADQGSATAEEVRLAMADARCQTTSRFQQRLYDAVWDETVKLYRANFDSLERVKAKLKKQDDAAQRVINTHAPTQPNR